MKVKICFKQTDEEIKQGYIGYIENCIVDDDFFNQLNNKKFIKFTAGNQTFYYSTDSIDCVVKIEVGE